MKTFLLGACLFLLSIYIKTSCCETRISHVVRSKRSLEGQSSEETFNMFISEQGSHFKENVNFDMAKTTLTYHVPAHRDLSESNVLVDFDSNMKATRLPDQDVCYIRPRSPDEPSMDLLRKSMNMVSTGKYKIRNGSRVFSSEWVPKTRTDLSKLSKNIIEFCRGSPIFDLKKLEQDGVTVSKGTIRTKRQNQFIFPLCKNMTTGYPNLQNCIGENYKTTCTYPIKNCVYYVVCDGGIESHFLRDDKMCTNSHELIRALCCDLECP